MSSVCRALYMNNNRLVSEFTVQFFLYIQGLKQSEKEEERGVDHANESNTCTNGGLTSTQSVLNLVKSPKFTALKNVQAI